MSNVCAEELPGSVVRVSWDAINLPGIVGYKVFYSQTGSGSAVELTRDVPSDENSVDVSGLESNIEYQFQVAAIAEEGSTIELLGARSVLSCMTTLTVALMQEPTSGGNDRN